MFFSASDAKHEMARGAPVSPQHATRTASAVAQMMVMPMTDDYSDDINTATEADLAECYDSKYLGAADLGDKKTRARIAKVHKEKMRQQSGGERPKLVVYFTNLDKPMVLNATNKNTLVDKLGRDPAKWISAEVGLFTIPTQFGGKPTRGLRLTVLSVPKKDTGNAAPVKPPSQPSKPAVEEPPADDPDDPGAYPDANADFSEAAE
jgi:hypothetical protein